MVASEPELSSNESDRARRCRPAGEGPGGGTDVSRGCPVTAAAAALLATLAALAGCGEAAAPPAGSVGTATVVRVIDGDTVELSIGPVTERARLLGIDAPESVSPKVPDQCFGAEASQALHDLLPPGSAVRIERDAESRDRYGRLLLYLYRSDDGLFVNQWMLESGLADAMAFEPNTTFAVPFEAARSQAEAAGAGLWSRCDGPDQPLE